jgi:hypothetical protein
MNRLEELKKNAPKLEGTNDDIESQSDKGELEFIFLGY